MLDPLYRYVSRCILWLLYRFGYLSAVEYEEGKAWLRGEREKMPGRILER